MAQDGGVKSVDREAGEVRSGVEDGEEVGFELGRSRMGCESEVGDLGSDGDEAIEEGWGERVAEGVDAERGKAGIKDSTRRVGRGGEEEIVERKFVWGKVCVGGREGDVGEVEVGDARTSRCD